MSVQLVARIDTLLRRPKQFGDLQSFKICQTKLTEVFCVGHTTAYTIYCSLLTY